MLLKYGAHAWRAFLTSIYVANRMHAIRPKKWVTHKLAAKIVGIDSYRISLLPNHEVRDVTLHIATIMADSSRRWRGMRTQDR